MPCIDRITSRVPGASRDTRAASSSPFSPGMAMSISATSGLRLAQDGQRLLAVARFDHALHVRQPREQRPDPRAHQRVVVSQ